MLITSQLKIRNSPMRYLLTGASEGLGAALGTLCTQKGIEVVAISRKKPSYPCHHLKTDLTSQTEIDAAADDIRENFATFDALINCAGILSVQKPEDISYEEAERLLSINLLAPIYLTARLLPLIKQNGADILNVGSTVGTKAYADQAAYGASKWGLRGFSLNLQVELQKTSCRTIQFNPGGFKSGIFEKATGQNVDLSKFMEPADLAQLMLTLLHLPKNMEVSEITVNRRYVP